MVAKRCLATTSKCTRSDPATSNPLYTAGRYLMSSFILFVGLSSFRVSGLPFLLPRRHRPRPDPRRIALLTLRRFSQQTMSSLEAKGRANVRQEASEIFEGTMDMDWAEGRAPLGLENSSSGSAAGAAPESPRVFYLRSLVVAGRKCGA